jgi:hypothetical protein
MTIHTERHVRQIDGGPDLRHVLNIAMARLAGHTAENVRIVVEVHEIADDIDAHPLNRLAALKCLTEFDDLRFRRCDKLMTSHTQPDGGNSCRRATPHSAMAILTGHFVVACVNLVAECYWLSRSGFWSLAPSEQEQCSCEQEHHLVRFAREKPQVPFHAGFLRRSE